MNESVPSATKVVYAYWLGKEDADWSIYYYVTIRCRLFHHTELSCASLFSRLIKTFPLLVKLIFEAFIKSIRLFNCFIVTNGIQSIYQGNFSNMVLKRPLELKMCLCVTKPFKSAITNLSQIYNFMLNRIIFRIDTFIARIGVLGKM